jgi:hypothetical protein
MDWVVFIQGLIGSSIVLGILTWLSKRLITAMIDRDRDRHRAELDIELKRHQADLDKGLERFRIEHSSLHTHRAEVIAELYRQLSTVQFLLNHLFFEMDTRQVREAHNRDFPRPDIQPHEHVPGVDLLHPTEATILGDFKNSYRMLDQYYHERRIYFSRAFCENMSAFLAAAWTVAHHYENVAFKDKDGKPMVNNHVVEAWERCRDRAPALYLMLEKDFRKMLGVEN